ncbi:MAG: hypothetical protein ACREKH_05760 [Candidatus Rokuibacteriota bacterium]
MNWKIGTLMPASSPFTQNRSHDARFVRADSKAEALAKVKKVLVDGEEVLWVRRAKRSEWPYNWEAKSC